MRSKIAFNGAGKGKIVDRRRHDEIIRRAKQAVNSIKIRKTAAVQPLAQAAAGTGDDYFAVGVHAVNAHRSGPLGQEGVEELRGVAVFVGRTEQNQRALLR